MLAQAKSVSNWLNHKLKYKIWNVKWHVQDNRSVSQVYSE